MKQIRQGAFLCSICILLLAGCWAAGRSQVPADSIVTSEPVSSPAPTPQPVRTVRFTASGDNLIHGSIYLQAAQKDGSYDFSSLYSHVAYFYKDYDLNFINQETLVNDELPASTYPCFSTPGELGEAAYQVGWRLFGGSNNHTYDKGSAGIEATLRFWDAMPDDTLYFGLYRVDQEKTQIPLYEKNGITFACLAYTDHTNGIGTPQNAQAQVIYTSQEDMIEKQITLAKKQADVVLVSVHWGTEDSHQVTDAQRTLAQKMADWGADLIIGTHPHVIQPAEWLTASDGREVFCAYSLGNFVSAQSRPDELFGYILTCTFRQQGDEACTVEDVQLVPTVTHYGSNYSDIRVWLLRDYTQEMMMQHGARRDYPYFDLDYIETTLQEWIDPQLLAA
ncbi:MAG: CapA family protein [Pygmaiobacter massiliensis]|nr:CapA family protein [Pygmaiobacter massiliensis]